MTTFTRWSLACGMSVFATLSLSLIFGADVVRPPKVAPPPPKKIDLTGPSNWGNITHAGDAIRFDGHPVWTAIGEVRKDGKVELIWTLTATGQACPGVYEITKGSGETIMVGVWGYGGAVQIEADGSLSGDIQHDRVYRPQPAELD